MGAYDSKSQSGKGLFFCEGTMIRGQRRRVAALDGMTAEGVNLQYPDILPSMVGSGDTEERGLSLESCYHCVGLQVTLSHDGHVGFRTTQPRSFVSFEETGYRGQPLSGAESSLPTTLWLHSPLGELMSWNREQRIQEPNTCLWKLGIC